MSRLVHAIDVPPGSEISLGDSDKHLDVQVSVQKRMHEDASWLAVSTVVHVHNGLGKFYMFFVAPAHRVIAPATLRSRLAWGAGKYEKS